MKILDYYIWDVVGLDVDGDERTDLESGLEESAWFKFLAEDLEELLGTDEYHHFVNKMTKKRTTKEQFVLAVKQKLQDKSIDFDEKMDESLTSTLKTFVADQIDYLEKDINELQDQTEKTLKLSFIKNLRELFEKEEWDKMGELFRKINGYTVQKSMVVNI